MTAGTEYPNVCWWPSSLIPNVWTYREKHDSIEADRCQVSISNLCNRWFLYRLHYAPGFCSRSSWSDNSNNYSICGFVLQAEKVFLLKKNLKSKHLGNSITWYCSSVFAVCEKVHATQLLFNQEWISMVN